MKDLLLKPYLELCVARGIDRSIAEALADVEFLADVLDASDFVVQEHHQGAHIEVMPPAVDTLIQAQEIGQQPPIADTITHSKAEDKAAQDKPLSDSPNRGAGAVVAKQKAKPAPVVSDMPPRRKAQTVAPKRGKYKTSLTTMQHTFLHHVCIEHTRGKTVTPALLCEIMRLPDGCSTLTKALEDKGYIECERPTPRKTIITPLKNTDGTPYAQPKALNGVTRCPTVYAEGYAGSH